MHSQILLRQCFVYVQSGLSPIQYHSESSTAAEDILAFCFHGQQIHQRPLWACETKRSANFVTCLWKWSPVCHNDSNDNLLILIGGPAISPWRAGTSGGGFARATVPSLRGTHSWEGGKDGVMFKNDHGFSASLQATGVKSPQMEINVNEANFWQTCSCQFSLFLTPNGPEYPICSVYMGLLYLRMHIWDSYLVILGVLLISLYFSHPFADLTNPTTCLYSGM